MRTHYAAILGDADKKYIVDFIENLKEELLNNEATHVYMLQFIKWRGKSTLPG